MGGGGLLQLVAYGAQDIYLTGNPQITFFKVVYRRHTNFSIESISNTFNGQAGFGRSVVAQISRNGDLIHRVYLQCDVPALASNTQWVDYVGLRLLKYVEIEIGGQRIDKHYSDWMYIWNELSLPRGKKDGYRAMVGDTLGAASALTTLYVPLEFWFCRNIGLALPLIALQYHEVKINIQFNDLTNLMVATSGTAALSTASGNPTDLANASLWVDYIFLDTDERRRFAQLSHEYLIEQLQFTGDESFSQGSYNARLNLNHPVKELVFVVQRDAFVTGGSNDWTNYGMSAGTVGTAGGNVTGVPSAVNPISRAQLKLNGQDRFAERLGPYFNMVQPFQHHENVPTNLGINVYSFALKPEEHQPSGTLNMSRIDTAVLALTTQITDSAKLKVFATNYNVLRIMSGMGGLAYSN